MSLPPIFRFLQIEVMFGVCLMVFAFNSNANEVPIVKNTAPAPIKLALQSAWQSHPNSRITEALLTGARARADAANRPLYNPELDLNSDKEGSDRISTANLTMAIDISGKRRARSDVGAAQLQIEEAQAQLSRRDFAASWLTALIGQKSAQQQAEIGEKRLGLMTRFVELAEKQFKFGDISSLEYDLALLARDEAQTEQAGLLADLAEAQETFQNSGGLPIQLKLDTISANYLPSIDINQSVDIEVLPEWQLANAKVLTAQRLINVAKKDRIADPTMGISAIQVDYGNVTDTGVGLSLSIPLHIRNTYQAEVSAALADSDAVSMEAERVRIELQSRAKRTVATYIAMQNAWQRWSTSKGTSVDRRTELLEKLWRAGELSTVDYVLQLKQSMDTALSGAELENRLWQSSTDYLTATGQLETWLGIDNTYGEIFQ